MTQPDINMLDMLSILGCYGVYVRDCTYFDFHAPDPGTDSPYRLVFRHTCREELLELHAFSVFDEDGVIYTCIRFSGDPSSYLDWRMVNLPLIREVV